MGNTTTTAAPADTLAAIASRMHAASHWLVASHMNPDGDAIGSARSLQLMGEALGKDVVVYIPGAVVPPEYGFIAPDHLVGTPPADVTDRLLICADCGNEGRLDHEGLVGTAGATINIDHHADNTRYGDLNHVVGSAPCATMLLWQLAGELGVEVDPRLATALYVGLVTDTGRFQYSNTTPDAFRMAAGLVESGADVHDIFRRVYEQVSFERTKLLGRALDRAERHHDGAVILTHLRRSDFVDAGAGDDDSEGIVEVLRGVTGAQVAVFLRDLAPDATGQVQRKGSLRTTSDHVDVSVIARTWSGGGHRQAAGFTTSDDPDAVRVRVVEMLGEQLDG